MGVYIMNDELYSLYITLVGLFVLSCTILDVMLAVEPMSWCVLVRTDRLENGL